MPIQLTKCYSHEMLTCSKHFYFPFDVHHRIHVDRCVQMKALLYRVSWYIQITVETNKNENLPTQNDKKNIEIGIVFFCVETYVKTTRINSSTIFVPLPEKYCALSHRARKMHSRPLYPILKKVNTRNAD